MSKDGQLLEYKLLVASFPYSNAAFVYPVPKENQECFLEGLKQIFAQVGGVPKRIWFDNLSAAVISIEKDGQCKCTDAFLRFAAHYRFDAVFCNANKGNEKGHVENKCGYSRRNWCVPIPLFTNQDDFAHKLAAEATADRHRLHYEKRLLIEALWQEESTKLLTLPNAPYQVFRLETGRVNGYGEVRFDQVNLPIVTARPEQDVLLKVYWDHIEVLNEQYQLLAEFPRPYTHKTIDIPWKEVIKGLRKKPRSVTHSQFVQMMPPVLRQFLLHEELPCRKQRLEWLEQWVSTYTMEEIIAALTNVKNWEHEIFFDQVSHRLYAIRHPEYDTIALPIKFSSPDIAQYVPDLSVYDKLHKGGKTA
ncbi:hypothetical protein KIAC18_002128 [Sporomusa sphaeroides]|uniref:hypothetical protein n=1 Tax=Sporomusa sphaeroides TaxID=47679 RepID=UPI003DA0A60A